MSNAFKKLFKKGYQQIIIIGTDCYDLDKNIICEANNSLINKDYIFGPSKDGGYYLLGMKTMNETLFLHKNWGESDVLRASLNDLVGADIGFTKTLNDIDNYQDLKENPRLITHINNYKIPKGLW